MTVKVLHVIDSGGLYGAEMMLLSLMEEQVRMGLEPLLASIGDHASLDKPVEVEAEKRGLSVRRFRMAPGPNLLGALEILRYAWAMGVDLLHSHGYKGNILLGFLPRFVRRLPMVATVHGWTCTGKANRMMVYEWLDGLSLARMDCVILVNPAMKDHARIRNRAGLAVEVVENGIAEMGEVTDAELDPDIVDFCKDGFVVGAVGRLSPEKGFDLLLEAAAGLAAEYSDLRLVILGEGVLRAQLEERVSELGLQHRVLMPGYVNDGRRYFHLFDLFAMPSLTEGLPIVLLEAMQSGVPIVASAVGGIPRLLAGGDCGLLIESGQVEPIRKGIRRLMSDQETAREAAKAAQQRVSENYSSDAMARGYHAVYRRVVT